MLLKSLLALVSFEKMEYIGIISVSSKAIIYNSRFILGEASCLGIDGFESIGMLGIGIDLG